MNPCAHADSLKLFNCKLVKWNYVIEVRFCIKNFKWFRPACHFFPRNFFFDSNKSSKPTKVGYSEFGNFATIWTFATIWKLNNILDPSAR